MDKKSKSIICTNHANGKKHDFKLFKESKMRCKPSTELLTDTGYQGLQKLHAKTRMPKKKSKKKPLTQEDKKINRQISSDRVLNENVIGVIKRFKITNSPYAGNA